MDYVEDVKRLADRGLSVEEIHARLNATYKPCSLEDVKKSLQKPRAKKKK